MVKGSFFDTKYVAFYCAALALAVALSAGGYVLANQSSGPAASSIGTVNVQGSASQKGTPDTLSLQLAVSTNASSAATALNRNNSEMAHVQSIFRSDGVAASNMQTNGLSVGPTYNNKGNVNGYNAEDDLSVTFHDIARSGTIIDAAENAVGNDVQINSVNFSLSNDSALVRRARILAMQQARAEAEDFARGAGESLGAVESITQVENNSSPEPVLPEFNAAAGAARAPVPIRPGTQSVSVQVQVVYRLIG